MAEKKRPAPARQERGLTLTFRPDGRPLDRLLLDYLLQLREKA